MILTVVLFILLFLGREAINPIFPELAASAWPGSIDVWTSEFSNSKYGNSSLFNELV